MGNRLAILGVFAFVGLLFVGAFAFERWKFAECKKVGHGTAYCIFMVGSR